MARQTEFGEMAHGPITPATRDTLALYRGIHEMFDAPKVTAIHDGQIAIETTGHARDFWKDAQSKRNFRALDTRLFHSLPSSAPERHGAALTFWVQTDPYSGTRQRAQAEAKAHKRMEELAQALSHRYGIPLKAVSQAPIGAPTDGPGMLAVALATDNAHIETLMGRMYDDIATAHSYCGDAEVGLDAMDSVLRHLPAPPKTPEIDQLRNAAFAIGYTDRLDADQANLVISDYIRDKKGMIDVAHTDKSGRTTIRVPVPARILKPAASMDILPHPDRDRACHNTDGIVIWFDPEKRSSARSSIESLQREVDAGTKPEMLFVRALQERFGIHLDAEPVHMPEHQYQPGLPTYGLLLRSDASGEETLLTKVREELSKGFKRASDWDHEKPRQPKLHPRVNNAAPGNALDR